LTDEDQELLKTVKFRVWTGQGTPEELYDSWMRFCGAHKWRGRWMGVSSLEEIESSIQEPVRGDVSDTTNSSDSDKGLLIRAGSEI
jgi:hypothetical protein